jgi:ABC-2 type transport system permease protein
MTAQAPAAPRTDLGAIRLRPGGVVLSEVLKLVTVRSTWWSFAASLAIALGLAFLLGASFSADGGMGMDPSALALSGSTLHLQFVGLVIAVLGAISIGGEYSTGMIRSTYTAVPRRLPSLLARGAVVSVAAFLLGVLTTFGSFAIISPMLAAKGLESSLADDGTIQGLLGGALYLAAIGAFSVGLAALLRSTAAAIGIAVGILFVLPIVASIAGSLLQAEWITDASPFLLSNLGARLTSVGAEGEPTIIAAVVALVLWVLAAWLPALTVTRLRDV